MGQPKALLQIGEKRFVDYLAESFSEAGEVLFSVKEAGDFPDVVLPHIVDDFPGCGPLAGIHSSLKNAKNPWVFIVACDTPFVKKETLETMMQFCSDDITAVIPKEEDGRLHVLCGLYHRSTLPKIEKYLKEGNYRVRSIFDSDHAVFLSVKKCFNDTKAFRNVNTPEDYKEMVQ